MSGRWPANVILSPGMAEALDGQSGTRRSSGVYKGDGSRNPGQHVTNFAGEHHPAVMYDDHGGASRFFLEAGYEPWELEWILANGLRPCGE